MPIDANRKVQRGRIRHKKGDSEEQRQDEQKDKIKSDTTVKAQLRIVSVVPFQQEQHTSRHTIQVILLRNKRWNFPRKFLHSVAKGMNAMKKETHLILKPLLQLSPWRTQSSRVYSACGNRWLLRLPLSKPLA